MTRLVDSARSIAGEGSTASSGRVNGVGLLKGREHFHCSPLQQSFFFSEQSRVRTYNRCTAVRTGSAAAVRVHRCYKYYLSA